MRAAIDLFDRGSYLASHELFEELWEQDEGEGAEVFKGLIQASMCLYHFQKGNLDGARKHYRGHRRCLAPFLPAHLGVDVERLLRDMQNWLAPVLRARAGESVAFPAEGAPQLGAGS